MDPHISVHSLDDGACLAIIHADGHISDTDDPALVLRLRAALAEVAPDGPDPFPLGWACAVLSALKRHGLRGRAVVDEHGRSVVYQTPS